jgi:GT2 family glycosyltransferase
MSRFEPPSFISQVQTFGALSAECGDGTAIIVATRGRPEIVASLVDQLSEQTKPPAHVFVIVSKPEDAALISGAHRNITIAKGREGSTFQRNDGLKLAGARFRHIVFFDDDFVPSRFWLERMEALFAERSDIVGMTGDVLADGTRTEGIRLDDAKAIVEQRDSSNNKVVADSSRTIHEHFPYGSNVGCNMAYRYSAIADIAFDEKLPLYAWHEDSDFRGQVERRGLFVRSYDLWGVHLGHKKGRGNGLTLGYSQIANAVYLAKKGTVPIPFLANIAIKNVIINALRSIKPEKFVDRRGRLKGNILALFDLLLGRLVPDRILQL